ncbi:MAG TPA: hypothetical protein VMS31_00090, partial [Pyrinomonadaceae bacterium]|nr:hypothetical protein [Pyrinomonadaceae bacterium]
MQLGRKVRAEMELRPTSGGVCRKNEKLCATSVFSVPLWWTSVAKEATKEAQSSTKDAQRKTWCFPRHQWDPPALIKIVGRRPLRGLAFVLLIVLAAFPACNRGTENAEGIVIINAPATGEVRRILAREGMEIAVGQPIAEIAVYSPTTSTPTTGRDQKQSPAVVNLQSAQAEIEAARSEVVRHEVEVQRLTPLVSSGQASPGELDGERALYERAQQRLQKARTAAQQAQTGLVTARQQSLNSPAVAPTPNEQIVTITASS